MTPTAAQKVHVTKPKLEPKAQETSAWLNRPRDGFTDYMAKHLHVEQKGPGWGAVTLGFAVRNGTLDP